MQICQIWCGITRPCCAFNQYTGNSSRTLLVRFSFRHCSPHPMCMPHGAWANRYQIYNTQPTSIRSVDRPHHPQTKKGAPDCPWQCPRGRWPEGSGTLPQVTPLVGRSSWDWPTQLWSGSGVVHRFDQVGPPLEPALWLCALPVIRLVAPRNHCCREPQASICLSSEPQIH